MKSRRATVLTAALAISATLLTACGSGSSGSSGDGKAELKFLTFTSPNVTKSLWEGAAANVTKKYPDIGIKLLYTPNLDRQAYAKQLLATGQLPDILWDAPGSEFVKAGALLSFDAADLKGMNVPSGYGTIGGKTYNLWNGSFLVPALHYNTEAFAKAGLKPPTTFDELLTDAVKLKAAGITPFLVQSGSDLWSAGYLLQGIVSADVYGKTPDWLAQRKAGKVKFSDADFLGAVDKFVELRDKGLINKDALSINYAQATTQWKAGKAAMWPMGSWATATKTSFKVGVFPFPTADGSKVLPVSIGAAVYVSAKTAHPAEAKKAAVSLITNPSWQANDMKSDGVLPIVSGIKPLAGTSDATLSSLALLNDTSYKHVVGFLNEVGDDSPPPGFSDAFGKAMQGLIGGDSAKTFTASLDKSWDSLDK
ncbi:ABC transporter substrate-binding protein [Streptomyces sp. NPDC101776]|uniref:ABC transporter substrate-binding protein n=1 Tax=Streptomyces sp. NPDC101776 TaxID=3366146 RepID=UPI003824291E